MARHWKSHPLEDGCPPRWATAWGQDRYGVFVKFEVGEATQRMRWIMPGSFLMGSPEDEEGRLECEGPQHQVVISRGFWLFETPCCQDLWEAVLGKDSNPSHFRGPRRPVESVSWEESVNFINTLNDRIPELWLRLPREAEWEYACRAGTTAARYGELDTVAWHSGNSKETQDVGKKQINPWGLYDMLGNVWEWCRDVLRTYTSDVVRDPDGGRGDERVIRGGSWGRPASVVRATFRGYRQPGLRLDTLGFRPLSSGIEEDK